MVIPIKNGWMNRIRKEMRILKLFVSAVEDLGRLTLPPPFLNRMTATKSPTKRAIGNEFFPSISKIPFNPAAKANDFLAFKEYDKDKVIMGRKMKDWLRFSVCYWHTFRGTGADPFGEATLTRPWEGMYMCWLAAAVEVLDAGERNDILTIKS